MNKINIIDSVVYNRISAGEVIERPMSVIKECVENSIDSGAEKVTIHVSNNAKNLRIIDNGEGMSRDDAKIAFLPHTTSKIKKVEDLDTVETLGFRGEALASIASVSMVTLNTFDLLSQETTKIEIKGGKIENVSDSSIDCGTDINVENLFYNTPVREKFLKSAKSEESEITNLISKFILAYPNISFVYYLNGEMKLKFDGDGFEKAVYIVYGKSTIDNSIYVQENKNGISVSGYIGKIGFTKANRTYQTVILNGRNVVNETISTAIFKAYQPYLMKRCYPFYVLHITVPTETIDVNVHPTKHDVRFSDNKVVFSSLYSIITKNITSQNSSFIVSNDKKDELNKDTFDYNSYQPSFTDYKEENKESKKDNNNKESSIDKTFYIPNARESIIDKNVISSTVDSGFMNVTDNNERKSDENYIGVFKKPKEPSTTNGFYLYDSESEIKNAPNFDNLKVIGVFNNTYIIAECNEVLYLIDQHAAHERILYDKYTLSYYNQKILLQDLIVPYMLDLNPLEDEFMRKNISNLYILGFRIENFGQNTYRIMSVPADLTEINFDAFFKDVFSDLDRIMSIEQVELLRERLMQKACKNAVKAGMPLSNMEIKQLFSYLKHTAVLTCPHGRPIIVQFTKNEIERMFKRIV